MTNAFVVDWDPHWTLTANCCCVRKSVVPMTEPFHTASDAFAPAGLDPVPFWRFTQQSALSPPALATSILFMALGLSQTRTGFPINPQTKVWAEKQKTLLRRL